MNEQILILRTTLEGLRGMACVEACAGSKGWRSAVETIDRILEETNPGYAEAEIEELMHQEPLEDPFSARLERTGDSIAHETSFARIRRIMKDNQIDKTYD